MFLVIAGLRIAAQGLAVIVLLINPLHPIRQHFKATTIAAVPAEVWPPESAVRVEPGIAVASVDPWAYIKYQPASRWFVLVTAVVSFSWWACALLMLLSLRLAFNNLSGGTPFPQDNIRCIRRTGLAVVILAEVFRAGADLQDDQALTV